MNNIVQKIFSLLSPRERLLLYLLFVGAVVMALIDAVGIVSIMPFMAVVANPEIIQTNQWLARVYFFFRFESPTTFLFFLGMMVLLLLVITNITKAFFAWLQLRYGAMRAYSLSSRLLSKYLAQPYMFFLNRNTAELSRNILSLVSVVVNGVLRQIVAVAEKAVGALVIIALLLYVDPYLAVTTSCVLGGIYYAIYITVRRKLLWWGQQSVDANFYCYKLTSEALGGIKDLKVLGREDYFLNLFSKYSLRNAKYAAQSGVVALIPMYSLEVLAFGGILCIVLYFLALKQNLAQVLPLIALYAFAAKRVMPALQGIFTGISSIRYNLATLDVLYHDFTETLPGDVHSTARQNKKPLPFSHSIELRNISFAYSVGQEPAIKNITLTIHANTSVAFVGATGSGKTTLVDIILGLLQPQTGTLFVDGIQIDGTNIARWQKNIGYVPQHIFLSDDTVTRNIAFGIPDELIVMERVRHAARVANIAEFIEKELPLGYDTFIGERGVRLSGGERQRIGIARAVYHDPAVLILDEATSALDGVTETAVMDAIHTLANQKTIILIAHRLTTVQDCDYIYLIDSGRIKASGTYAELMEESEDFRAMSKTATL